MMISTIRDQSDTLENLGLPPPPSLSYEYCTGYSTHYPVERIKKHVFHHFIISHQISDIRYDIIYYIYDTQYQVVL